MFGWSRAIKTQPRPEWVAQHKPDGWGLGRQGIIEPIDSVDCTVCEGINIDFKQHLIYLHRHHVLLTIM